MFPELETERLELKEITDKDTEQIFACFSNELVTRYYGQEMLTNIEQAKPIIDFFQRAIKKNGEFDGGSSEKAAGN
jgi:ribosomal-protein-alanine N-acetyltransferase